MRKLLFALFIAPVISFAQENPREFSYTEGDTTYTMKQYFICFLNKGPNRDTSDSLAVAKIQKGHLAHLDSLANEGKIHIVGPMGDDGDIRGIVVFDVATKEEALALEGADPAVKAGRLVMEVHPWWTAKGSCLR